MLENDIYVDHTVLDIHTYNELLSFLREKIGYTGSDFKTAVLVLCAFSFYLTQEELSFLCPLYPLYSHLSSRVFKPLVEQGYMQAEKAASAKEYEGTARVFYYVTAQGYQYANSLCHGKLTARYKKNRSKVAKSHTYYIGYNFFQFLKLGYALTWEREYLLSERSFSYKNSAPILQVDAKCVLYERFGQEPFLTVYVEQDLGTEHNDVLLSKIDDYSKLGIMDYPLDSVIAFSFSQKGVTGKKEEHRVASPYTIAKCQQLMDYMDMMHLDDVYDAYLTGYPDTEYISTLLLKCGAARVNKDGDGLKKSKLILDRSFLEEFKSTVVERRNPYQQRDFNLTRAYFSMSRLEEMVKLLYRNVDREHPFMQRLRRGYQIFYLPTTLITERFGYAMLSNRIDKQNKLALSLSCICSDVRYNAPLSNPLQISDKIKLNLRNEFVSVSKNNIHIYVEFLCFDVGAWLRALYLAGLKNNNGTTLVCVIESRKQLEDLHRVISNMADSATQNILFLMLYDIGKADRLFRIEGEKMKRIYVSGSES